ncbi:MAG: DNA-processing protein DprA [Cyclobacteriaceae bacterium]
MQLDKVGQKTAYKIAKNIYETFPIRDNQDLIERIESCSQELSLKKYTNDDYDFAFHKADVIINESDKEGIKFITIFDLDYPQNLENLRKDVPIILNYKGDIKKFTNRYACAVIGTREPTEHGYKLGLKVGEIFGEHNFIVVSGLAKGCDTAGHLGCLNKKGTTAAVLAHGLHKIYPKENRGLADRILEEGGLLISEYFLHEPARQNYFVQRDRIQAGLSDFIFIVETGIKGGTMHTVNFAFESHIKIFAYNHPAKYLGEDKVQGNQFLINERRATPVGNPDDIDSLLKKFKSVSHNITWKSTQDNSIPKDGFIINNDGTFNFNRNETKPSDKKANNDQFTLWE